MSISLLSSDYNADTTRISLVIQQNPQGSRNGGQNVPPPPPPPTTGGEGSGARQSVFLQIDLAALIEAIQSEEDSDGSKIAVPSQVPTATADAEGETSSLDQLTKDLVALVSAVQSGDTEATEDSAGTLAQNLVDLIAGEGKERPEGAPPAGEHPADRPPVSGPQLFGFPPSEDSGAGDAGDAQIGVLLNDFIANIRAEYAYAVSLGEEN